MAVPQHILKFAEKSMEQATLQTFAKCLNLTGTRFLNADRETGVRFEYKIPENLCYHSHEKPVLACSSALAVFDELSSYAFVVKDSTCRFGVSVFLSTEILHTIPAGKDVIIIAKANKIGKTLGFASMEMYDKNGLLLARGEHIKHLPMGPVWDFMARLVLSPVVLPVILRYGDVLNKLKDTLFGDKVLVSLLVGGEREKSPVIKSNEKQKSPEIEDPPGPGIGDVFEKLGVVPLGVVSTDIVRASSGGNGNGGNGGGGESGNGNSFSKGSGRGSSGRSGGFAERMSMRFNGAISGIGGPGGFSPKNSGKGSEGDLTVNVVNTNIENDDIESNKKSQSSLKSSKSENSKHNSEKKVSIKTNKYENRIDDYLNTATGKSNNDNQMPNKTSDIMSNSVIPRVESMETINDKNTNKNIDNNTNINNNKVTNLNIDTNILDNTDNIIDNIDNIDTKSDCSSSFDNDSATSERTVGTYELRVRPVLCNLLGRLHGGALAMSIEHTARMYRHHSNGSDDMVGIPGNSPHVTQAVITRMEITYKAAMLNKLEISCFDDEHSSASKNIKNTEKNEKNGKNNVKNDEESEPEKIMHEKNTHEKSDTGYFEKVNPYQCHTRRSLGEVFNRFDDDDSKRVKSPQQGSAATYTCYWSK